MKLLLALAALPVLAQVVRIDIAGAPNPMVVGRSVKLMVAARNPAGEIVQPGIAWTSSNTRAVTVDSQGIVKAVALGTARITAAVGAVRGQMDITAVPLRVEIDPPAPKLGVGDKQQFTARILDTDRQPIAGATASWTLLTPNGFGTTALRIDAAGMLSATGEGRFTVQATAGGIKGFTPVDIRLRPQYRLSKALSNDPISGAFKYVAPRSNAVFNDSGQFALTAWYQNWGQQTLLGDNGRIHGLVGSGESDWGFSRLRRDYTVGGVTSRGEVLLSSGDGLTLAGRDEVTNVLPEGVYLGFASNFGAYGISSRAINDRGDIAFRATRFQWAGSATVLNGIFKISRNQLIMVWLSDQPLEGLSGVISTGNPIIDGLGNLYFSASAGGVVAYYKGDGASALKKVVATRDTARGSTITTINPPVVSDAGDLAYRVVLANGVSFRVRERADGQREESDFGATVLAVHGDQGMLYTRANPNGGLYLLNGESDRLLLALGAPAPDGGTITSFDVGGLSASGDVFAQVRTSRGAAVILKVGGEALLKPGDMIESSPPPFFILADSLVRGSPLRLKVGLPSSGLLEADGLKPVIPYGDVLPGNLTFTGTGRYVDTGASGVYFLFASRLFRRTATGYELLATLGNPVQFAANRRGQAVYYNNQVLYLYSDTRVTQIADGTNGVPGATNATRYSDLAIDDRGRVLVIATGGNTAPGLYLYDGAWRAVAVYGQTAIRGEPITTAFSLKASSGKFFVVANTRFASYVISLEDKDWTVEFGLGDSLPASNELISTASLFDVNAAGDLAVRVNSPSGNYILGKSKGAIKQVHYTQQAIEGHYLNNPVNLVIQDDGSVYMAGLDHVGRFVILRADPL